MNGRKSVSIFLSVIFIAFVMGGCVKPGNSKNENDGETKDVTLTVWGPAEEQEAVDGYGNGILKTMCDKFNIAHPEWRITFKYGTCSEADARDEVVKDVAAAADVYMFANDQIPALVEAGAISELDADAADTVKKNNENAMSSSVQYKNKMYGVPFTSNTWFLYYDKSKFSESEVKYLDTIMAKDLGSDVKNFAFPIDKGWYMASFYYAAGCTLFGDGTDVSAGCSFDNKDGVEVTKYLADLTKNKRFSCENNGSSISMFEKRKLGAYCSGSWDAYAIREILGGDFGVTTTPVIRVHGKEGTMKSYAGSKAIGVNPHCKNQDVAMALALYLGSEECQQIRFFACGIAPTNKNVAASDTIQSNVVASVQNEQILNSSVLQPILDEMDAFWKPTEKMGQELMKGKVTKKNAAKKTKAMVKGILAKP